MSKNTEAAELKAKLETYRLLSLQFSEGMSAKNIRLLSAELEQELRKYGPE